MTFRIGAKFDEETAELMVRGVENGELVADWILIRDDMDSFQNIFSDMSYELESLETTGIEGEWDAAHLRREVQKIERCGGAWSDAEGESRKMLDVFWFMEQTYRKPIGVDNFAKMLLVAASWAGRLGSALMAPVCTDFLYGSWVPKGMSQAWKSPVFRQPGVFVSGPVAYIRPALMAAPAANLRAANLKRGLV